MLQTTREGILKTPKPKKQKWSLSKLACLPWNRKNSSHASLPKQTSRSNVSGVTTRGCSRSKGNFLVTLYFFVKCLYLSNVVGQIYLMEKFVGSKDTFYGARVLIDLLQGRDWQESGNFPRVTFCDMEAKKLGKNHL